MLDCVQHSSSVLIHYRWNPSQWKQYQKINVTIFCATFSIKAFFKITVEQHIKTSKGSRSNWMLKDEHKHWKVKTVTSLPIAFIDFTCLSDQMSDSPASWGSCHLCELWGGGGRPPFMDGGSATKIFPEFAQVSLPVGKWAMGKLKFETRSCDCFGSKGQNMDQGSMDPHFGPFHGSPVMDQVHGYFFIFIERFWTGSMDTFFK